MQRKRRISSRRISAIDTFKMIAMLLLISVLFIYLIHFEKEGKNIGELIHEAEVIYNNLVIDESGSKKETAFIAHNTVDNDRLNNIIRMEYKALKSEFGVDSNFCIYFEDQDGRLMEIAESGKSKIYIGDPELIGRGACK